MLTYTLEEFFTMRGAWSFSILRSTRKLLFRYKLWNPNADKNKFNIQCCTNRPRLLTMDNNTDLYKCRTNGIDVAHQNKNIANTRYNSNARLNQISIQNTLNSKHTDRTNSTKTKTITNLVVNSLNSDVITFVKNTSNSISMLASKILPSNRLRIGLWNACSLSNIYVAISQTIYVEKIDHMCLTETWHSNSQDAALLNTVPSSIYTIDRSRTDSLCSKKRGGGLAFIINNLLSKNITILPLCELIL